MLTHADVWPVAEMEEAIGMRDDGSGDGVLTRGQLAAIERNEALIRKHETDMLPQVASYICMYAALSYFCMRP
jgi:hypothetical protein